MGASVGSTGRVGAARGSGRLSEEEGPKINCPMSWGSVTCKALWGCVEMKPDYASSAARPI